MSDTNESVQRVIEITGASEQVAKSLLDVAANNVEVAISLFFDQNLDAAALAPALAPVADVVAVPLVPPAAGLYVDDDDENVRAPIPPRREQLIGPEDDNFASPPSLARAHSRIRVCPLRDFAREGALMEEQLQLHAGMPLNMHLPDVVFGSAAISTTAENGDSLMQKSSRLGDLFRPPTELIFPGGFQAARDHALKMKVFLLVNVQNDSFDSHALNRDVWKNAEMHTMVKRDFLLWQVDADTSEGRRFVAFYHCGILPYVCVVDPLTGEELWHSAEPNETTLYTDLRQFLRRRKRDLVEIEDNAPSTSKKGNLKRNGQPLDCSTSTKKRHKVTDMSEEEQMAMAIRNSMRENGGEDSEEDNAISNDCFIDSDGEGDGDGDSSSRPSQLIENNPTQAWNDMLGSEANEFTALRLRLTDEDGSDKMNQLRWPSNTKVKVLSCYIAQTFKHIPSNGYKLICAFPRLSIDPFNNDLTLKEVGLHPSANLHINLDDDD